MAVFQSFLPVVNLLNFLVIATHCQGINISCTTEGSIRLVGGNSEFGGRLEICLNRVWGTVCDDRWTIQASQVVCRQIQNQTGQEIRRALTYYVSSTDHEFSVADVTQPIALDDVSCTGSEQSLLSCNSSTKNINCDHIEDISVTCVPNNFSLLERQIEDTGTTYNDTSICSNSSEQEETTESVEGCILYLSGISNSNSQNLCNVFYTLGVSTVFISAERHVNYPEIPNKVFLEINEIFDPLPSPCREIFVRMICYYYFPPCGNITHFIEPQSVCASTCTNITEVYCSNEWNTVLSELNVRGLISLAERFNAHYIDCARPDLPFDEPPQCCSNIGFDSDTVSSFVTTQSKGNGPAFQIIVPVVVVTLILMVMILGLGVYLFIVWRFKSRRPRSTCNTIHAHSDLQLNSLSLRSQPETVASKNAREVEDENLKLAGNKYMTYVQHNKNPDKHPLAPETPSTTKLSPEFLQEMSDAKLVIPKRLISITQCVGQGEFGIVYKAYLCGWERKDSTIAMKTLRAMYTPKDISDLTKESLKMKSFNHPNVLNLIGVCIDAGEAPCIVMPYMANGSLLAYLKKERSTLNVPDEASEDMVLAVQKKLLSMCLQVAKGMDYLASQRFVHRDLAARNCMIDSDFVIKVADFGLSEDIYARNYFRQGNAKDESGSDVKLPIKWMAIESLVDGIFNEKTDVWSYGVTCWEVFSLGRTPYPAVDPFTLIKHLEGRGRLDKPSNAACSDEIYDVMMSCWFDQPHTRPQFSDLVTTVNSLLEKLAGYMDFSQIQTHAQQHHEGNETTSSDIISEAQM